MRTPNSLPVTEIEYAIIDEAFIAPSVSTIGAVSFPLAHFNEVMVNFAQTKFNSRLIVERDDRPAIVAAQGKSTESCLSARAVELRGALSGKRSPRSSERKAKMRDEPARSLDRHVERREKRLLDQHVCCRLRAPESLDFMMGNNLHVHIIVH